MDVLTRKLTEYVNRFPLDDEWDEQCSITLREEITAISHGDEWAMGYVEGVLAMLMRDDPRFEQLTDELVMSILSHDECVVHIEPGNNYACVLCDRDNPPLQRVVKSQVVNRKSDPTETYTLACGHTVI